MLPDYSLKLSYPIGVENSVHKNIRKVEKKFAKKVLFLAFYFLCVGKAAIAETLIEQSKIFKDSSYPNIRRILYDMDCCINFERFWKNFVKSCKENYGNR